jgi:predicted DNA-binding transcriptional regulator YafY
MRADRLVAALLLLQARGRVTAAELADELEVSVATARRDLEALSAAGIPVYPQAGRGGGWSLVGGARTDLSGLSAAEAQALFLLVGPAAAVSGEAKAALRKLVQALPRTFRSDAEAAATATVIDPARWGEPDRGRPEIVDLLQTAVVRRRKIRLAYVGRTRERTERLVDPWGLVDKDDIWYLVAGTDRGQRTFRVDRILGAEPTELPAERPEGFTLATAWEQVVGEVERQRSRTWATVLIESRSVWVLRRQFGRHCHPDGELDDGRTRVRLAAPTPLDIARHLAGWGTGIEVVEPPSVQTELARIGAELTSRYGSNGRGSGRGRGGGASWDERRRRDQRPGRVGAVGVEEELERAGRDLAERYPDGREGDGEPADHRDVVVADE